ncbi:hypothetical protein B0I37DRAFT_381659 [Chaetomium sp. MPI-CAGE-AT-0009]|nr:hypothetical protein B0I37DRAFT_381659 [Chaetomium sp. MPI-CAGE-AT-0009]
MCRRQTAGGCCHLPIQSIKLTKGCLEPLILNLLPPLLNTHSNILPTFPISLPPTYHSLPFAYLAMAICCYRGCNNQKHGTLGWCLGHKCPLCDNGRRERSDQLYPYCRVHGCFGQTPAAYCPNRGIGATRQCSEHPVPAHWTTCCICHVPGKQVIQFNGNNWCLDCRKFHIMIYDDLCLLIIPLSFQIRIRPRIQIGASFRGLPARSRLAPTTKDLVTKATTRWHPDAADSTITVSTSRRLVYCWVVKRWRVGAAGCAVG